MNVNNQASPLAALKGFVGKELIWILSLVPFALAAVKLFGNSGGSFELLLYLLQTVNIVTLLLATIIPLIPQAIYWAFVMSAILTWPQTGVILRGLPIPALLGFASLATIVLLLPKGILVMHLSATIILVCYRTWTTYRRRHTSSSNTQPLTPGRRMNRPGFDAASFCVEDDDYGQALPGRAA